LIAEPYLLPYYTKKTARALLPKVGDRLMRRPEMSRSIGISDIPPRPCVVDYVNERHLWYRVRFETGFTQCYKVPAVKGEEL
jgi:hypothetical protein